MSSTDERCPMIKTKFATLDASCNMHVDSCVIHRRSHREGINSIFYARSQAYTNRCSINVGVEQHSWIDKIRNISIHNVCCSLQWVPIICEIVETQNVMDPLGTASKHKLKHRKVFFIPIRHGRSTSKSTATKSRTICMVMLEDCSLDMCMST